MEIDRANDVPFFKSIEGAIFLVGCLLLAAEALLFFLFAYGNPGIRDRLLSVIIGDIFGGIGAGISLGLEVGLPLNAVVLVFVIFNITLLFLFYPIIIRFYEHLIELKFIGKALSSTKEKAERHLAKIEGWGALGVAIFVWIPIYSTGVLVGAILGRLIGMRTITVFIVVISSLIASAIAWAYAFDLVLDIFKGMGRILPTIFVVLIVVFVLFHRFYGIYKKAKLNG